MQGANIVLLTGKTGAGKTTFLKRLLKELASSGIHAGGILAPGRYLDSGSKDFDLELIPGEKKYPLSSRKVNKHWMAIGGFYFNPLAVDAGLLHLTALARESYALYLLDEIGPFELEGHLWAPAIPGLLAREIPMIWTVRESLLEQVKTKWEIPGSEIVVADDRAMEKIRDWMDRNLHGRQTRY